MSEVIVVGGGLVGLSVGYHLARDGVDVTVIDRKDPGKATRAGAGILSYGTSRSGDPAWQELKDRSVRYYPALLDLLAEDGAGDTGYSQPGSMLVAATEAERSAFDDAVDVIMDRQQQGVPGTEGVKVLDIEEARELFPPIGDVAGVLHIPSAAQVDGRLLMNALRNGMKKHGGIYFEGDVTSLEVNGGRVEGVHTGSQFIEGERVVITGGAWSDELTGDLGFTVPVRPQRGQIIHLRLPEGSGTADWTVINGFRGHYMVAWEDDRVAVGATREGDAGFKPYTTAAGVREVLDEALLVAPGLGTAQIDHMRIGLRPLSEDGNPVLGRVPSVDGVFVATGHGPSGLQLGPYNGKLVANLVVHNKTEHDITPFSIERFE